MTRIALLLLMLSAPLRAEVACGLTFDLPREWVAAVLTTDSTRCEIGLRPRAWPAIVRESRFPDDEYALYLSEFKASWKDAAFELGFVRDRQKRWGIYGRQRLFAEVQDTSVAAFSGWRSEPWFRGFAQDGRPLGDQPRIYSGNRVVLLLRGPDALLIGAKYTRRNPDITLDRDGIAISIISSIARAAH
jgi:hypothetical protein